jgi:formylmethanofuran dehydrogenase subunit B
MTEEIRTTCPFCSLFCSDLRLTFDGGRLVGLEPVCALAEAGYRSMTARKTHGQAFRKDLELVRLWLAEARQPLIVLSGDVEQEAATAALKLARKYSAILTCDEDLTGSYLSLAMQTAGILTGTLGDMKDQDLVILCGVQPEKTHPRLGEILRYSMSSRVLTFDTTDPLEAIRWLRLSCVEPMHEIPSIYTEVVNRVRSSPSGLIVFGPEWVKSSLTFTTELLLWVKELNQLKQWYAAYLPPSINSTGVVETLLEETGYPGNLRFGSADVGYSPYLWRTERLIQEGSIDLCILLGSPALISEETISSLKHYRMVQFGQSQPHGEMGIWIQVARTGVDAPGWVHRLDGVPVDLLPILPRYLPLMKDILMDLLES